VQLERMGPPGKGLGRGLNDRAIKRKKERAR